MPNRTLRRSAGHQYHCPCRACQTAGHRHRNLISPTVLRTAFRHPYAIAERPSPAQQAWDYRVHVVRLWLHQQWVASTRPLSWDLFQFRYNSDFRADVIASGIILASLAWFALCAARGMH